MLAFERGYNLYNCYILMPSELLRELILSLGGVQTDVTSIWTTSGGFLVKDGGVCSYHGICLQLCKKMYGGTYKGGFVGFRKAGVLGL